MKKIIAGLFLVMVLVLAACGNGDSAEENGGNDSGEGGSESRDLKIAHNLSEDHPIHTALTTFTENIEESSEGNISFQMHPNGVLGSESDVLEQVQNGSVHITKVSAGALESFSNEYSVFSLPYIFTSDEHYRNVMESDIVDGIYQSTEDQGFIGISYFDSGARSFYTADTPVETPEDLEGLTLRVMDSNTAIEMVELLGGTPTPLAYNEIYTSLQQGVIDGAESNPTALTTGQHGEVAKNFSYTEHTNIPDILVVSTDLWDQLSEDEKTMFIDAAQETREEHTELWNQALDEAVEEAKGMGVEFNEVDKEPFIERVQPLHEEFKEDERLAEIIDSINELDE